MGSDVRDALVDDFRIKTFGIDIRFLGDLDLFGALIPHVWIDGNADALHQMGAVKEDGDSDWTLTGLVFFLLEIVGYLHIFCIFAVILDKVGF